jgi:hypothetical protein
MQQWFVYPVQDGFELVIDSVSDAVLEDALAEVVAQYTDFNLAGESILDNAWVLYFVPAPVDVIPAPREMSADERRARAAHPAGKGRRIPGQDDAF